jgi:hypothetical protein
MATLLQVCTVNTVHYIVVLVLVRCALFRRALFRRDSIQESHALYATFVYRSFACYNQSSACTAAVMLSHHYAHAVAAASCTNAIILVALIDATVRILPVILLHVQVMVLALCIKHLPSVRTITVYV